MSDYSTVESQLKIPKKLVKVESWEKSCENSNRSKERLFKSMRMAHVSDLSLRYGLAISSICIGHLCITTPQLW